MMFALVQRCGKNLCLLALLCVLGVALAGFGGSAQSPATEPSSVGRATNLRASTVGQDDGSVRLTWSAADDAQVHFVVYLKSSDLEARNFGQVQMVPFTGTEGVVRGLEGGAEYSFIVTGMRWNWVVNYGAVWGSWSDWETTTPRGTAAGMGTALPATEPQSVGRATNLSASTVGQEDGSVRLTWTAADDAQVHFVVYLKSSDLEARSFGQVQMVPFAGTEGVVRGLEGGTEYSFIVTGMRWNWVNYGAVWGNWSDWETTTPGGSGVAARPESSVDRAALVALYNATGGSNWTDNTNWLSNAHIDEWYGVTTDDTGRVTELSLRENDLTGTIPSVLGRLTSLERLDLQGNDLTGSIPGELVNLNNLQRLDLDYNHLTGALPSWLGNLGNLQVLDLNDNLLTGEIPAALGNLANLELIQLRGNAFTGCVPAALQNVTDNDLHLLGLLFCGAPPAREFSTSQLEALFDEIIRKTEQREAFSEVKESNIGFSTIEDMKALRSEFVASKTESELYYALSKLSNARRDRHLRIRSVDGGLQAPDRASCVSAPIHVLPDLSDIDNPTFFVAETGEGRTLPNIGDVIMSVNGRTMTEHVNEYTPWIRHSSLHGLYWRMAHQLPQQVSTVPPRLYSGRLDLILENSSGQRYDVSLPYSGLCQQFNLAARYPGFDVVMQRENFNVWLDLSRQVVLLQWLDFEYSLIQDIVDLMEYAQRERILGYDMIIDVSWSGGGSRGAYAMQRLVDQPFHVTFGNVRLSDLGKQLIEDFASEEPNTAAPDIEGLNLSRGWLIDWARTDAMEAIRRGDEYTSPVPFKLAHLPKDSDGILQPAPDHFSGKVAIINARTWGGSHLDQFMAMYVDNDLATFIGMPTGGYSNTWEGDEDLVLPETGRPLVTFQWSIGHTIRPNGEVLEGNPAMPNNYIALTRHNFQGYHRLLLDTAIAVLDQ